MLGAADGGGAPRPGGGGSAADGCAGGIALGSWVCAPPAPAGILGGPALTSSSCFLSSSSCGVSLFLNQYCPEAGSYPKSFFSSFALGRIA